MPLHTPDGGFVAPEYQDLARKIIDGDGLGWPGDPRMWLGIGVVEDRQTKRTGRRLEVWRDNEDGTSTIVGHWHPSEQMRVCYDLAQMRADSPGHVSVLDRIDAANAAREKALSDSAAEQMMETLDHAIRLHHDRTQPRNRFFMAGAPNRGARA